MKVSRNSRRWMRLQNRIFLLLFIALMVLLAWLSTRYSFQADWTADGRNTLSEASTQLLQRLKGEVRITAYATEDKLLRKRIAELVGRYQRYHPDMVLEFINPDLEPQEVRARGITMNGELFIQYAGSSEKLRTLTERGLSSALQRVVRGGERRIAFLSGHGERRIDGNATYDLGNWTVRLKERGYTLYSLNLVETPQIPRDTALLVIASPRSALLAGEAEVVRRYVEEGGNLLWLHDPDGEGKTLHGLEPVAETLAIRFQQGIVVDPNVSQLGELLFGSNDPRIALVARYDTHPVTDGFDLNTLFPIAGGIETDAENGWAPVALLKTLSNTWLETGEVKGMVSFDAGTDSNGPVTLGVAQTRARLDAQGESGEQRVLVIADGDFLSNAFLGASGNLQLAMNMVNWLSHDDKLIAVPVRTVADRTLVLSTTAVAVIGFGFLAVLPLGLLASGLLIWYRRRRR